MYKITAANQFAKRKIKIKNLFSLKLADDGI